MQMFGNRVLYQNAAYMGVGVQAFHQRLGLGLRGIGAKTVNAALHAYPSARLLLHRHIRFGTGVGPDQYGSQMRHDAPFRL